MSAERNALAEMVAAWDSYSYVDAGDAMDRMTEAVSNARVLLAEPVTAPDPTGLRCLAPHGTVTISHENLARHWELTVDETMARLEAHRAAGELAYWDGYGAITVTRIGPAA
jgi:hypothetical protein